MSLVCLRDVAYRVKDPVDKDTTDLIYYVGGEHFTNGSLTVKQTHYRHGHHGCRSS